MALTRVSTGGIQDDAVTDAKLPANSVGNSEMKDDAVGVAELSATGTASSSTFLRGDNTWVTPTDTNTQLTTEEVQDIVGAMFTGNTETNIAATYQDADGTIDLVSTDTDTQVGGATGVDFNDDVKVRFGTGNDVEIFHDGSDSFIRNTTGDLYITGAAGSDDVIIWSQDDIWLSPQNGQAGVKVIGAGAVELYHNANKKLETSTNGTTLTGNLFISDSADTDSGRIKLGAGEDLQIYHEGSNSYLNDTGTGFLSVQGSEVHIRGSNNENGIKVITNGRVELYYDNAKKLETVTGGVTVTGTCTATAFAGDGSSLTGISTSGGATGIDFNDNVKARFGTGNDLEIYHDGSSNLITSSTANTWIKNTAEQGFANGSEYEIRCTANAGVYLYYDNSLKLDTLSGGIQVHGNLYQHDGEKAIYGTGDDLWVFHNGSHSFITERGTGNLYIRGGDDVRIEKYVDDSNGEPMIIANADGAVELYYDNSKKLETTSYGVAFVDEAKFDNDTNAGRDVIWDPANDQMRWLDNTKATFGTSSDLQIYHDGSDSYIYSNDKTLYINANSGGSAKIQIAAINAEKNADFKPNGAVELYYDGTKKFETSASGVSIPDSASYMCGDGSDLQIYHSSSVNTIRNIGTRLDIIVNSNEDAAKFNPNGAVDLYYDNAVKAGTMSGGFRTTGDLYMHTADSQKIRLGASDDLQLYHDGTDSYLENQTGNLFIMATNADKGIKVVPNGAVDLYYDNSKKLATDSGGVNVTGGLNASGNIVCTADGGKFIAGAGDDLQIYHDGSNSYLVNGGSGGNLYLQTYGENSVTAIANGAVELYYDGTKMWETNSSGTLMPDAKYAYYGNSGDMYIGHTGSASVIRNTTGNLSIQTSSNLWLENEDGSEVYIKALNDAAVELYYDNSKKLETTSYGLLMNGDLRLQDNQKLQAGGGSDLEIYHDGTTNIITGINTALSLRAKTGENGLLIIADNAASLYFDDSKKFETTADGVTTYGTLLHRGAEGGAAQIRVEADEGDDDADKWRMYSGTDGTFYFQNHASGSYENSWTCNGNGNIQLYYDNSKKFETKSTGVEIGGRLSINEGGQLVNESGLTVDSSGNTSCFRATGSDNHCPIMTWNNATSGSRTQIQFADGSSYTSRGSIYTNGSNVTYGGTSDYRLKQDDVLITDGITKVKALKPKRFKWKNNLSIGICDGFFAHEVQETAPTSGATIGTKDAVDSDGNPVYQQVDQAKLIPILTAALQEAISKIETLETKVAALESS